MNIVATARRRADHRIKLSFYAGASAMALFCAPTAHAQAPASQAAKTPPASDQAGTSTVEEIVVTGIKASLASAQNIKRNSATVVDAITAADIGALPDRSVTESLQRLPGVTISRFQGGNDPDHFSVEGTNVSIRGLNYVQSQFNGRDSFSVSFGRALDLSAVPSELLGSIEVYKEGTADMIEGGLGGVVNLNTRKPFDQKGPHMAFDAEANYSDFIKKTTPVGSILVSDTWDTPAGTFGLLADLSYSRLKNRADGMQVTNIQTRDGANAVAANTTSTPTLRTRLPGKDVAYAPIGASFRTQDFDRERKGLALAGQWESNDRTMLLTGQFLRSQATRTWNEHTFETESGLSEYNTFPAGCQPNGPPTVAQCPAGFADYQYDSNNVFEKGYITSPGTGWRTASSGQADSPTPTGGMQQNLSRRDRFEKTLTSDYGLNFKWHPTERLTVNLDGQYTRSSSRTLDFTSYTDTFADEELDLTGSIPQATPHKPMWNASPNPRIAGETDEQYFSDPANYFWRAAMDHQDESHGHEWAFAGDVTYDVDNDIPFVRKIKVGARYADRDQTVRYSSYNWGAISEVWSGTAVYLNQAGGDQAQFFDFSNFFRGKANAPVGGYYYALPQLDNFKQAAAFFKNLNQVWNTQNGGAGFGWVPISERAGVVPGTPYLPGEISTAGETVSSAYAMLDFGSSQPVWGNVKIDGNIGLRYVNTKGDSVGSVQFPDTSQIGTSYAVLCGGQGNPSPLCTLGEGFFNNLVAFSNGGSTPSTAKNHYENWLPSFNLRVGFTDNLQMRFAASKAMQRPDFGYLRNFLSITVDPGNPLIVQASAGNPYLKPAISNQFDLGLEWYFSKVGSLTGTVFSKDIKDFFYQSVVSRAVTNNGATEQVYVRGPANYDGTGKIRGVELAYQQTYDFLPGWMNGFGAGATYTYLHSKGLPNAFLSNVSDAPAVTPPTGRGSLPFEGLSKHNVNITGFYEKGPLSIRAAYNWRSKFLQTAADEIFPYFPIYNAATGQLDASVFYSVNKNVKVGIQGVNLTNEVTKTLQQFTPDGLTGPRSYFINDRRFSFILRGTF